MMELTHHHATAVNQLHTSYIIDILVITFPKAHLRKNIFYFNYEQSEASPILQKNNQGPFNVGIY